MSNVGGPTGPPKPATSGIQSTESTSKADQTPKTGSAPDSSAAASSQPGSQSSDSVKLAEHRLDGYIIGAKIHAQAEREMPTIGPNQKVDITDRDWRNHVLRGAPQINPVSTKAGNAPDLCGGAAMSNALVLSSKTPEQANANAKAVRDLAGSFEPPNPLKLSPQEDQALKNMESTPPKMSATDVQHLQQVMYRIGQRMPLAGANPSGTGLSTTQVGCAMSMLSARGAFSGSNVTMHCNRNTFQDDKGKKNTIDHWTVTVDRTFANSQGLGDRSIIQGGPPLDRLKGTPDWQNELILDNSEKPPKMYLQFKQQSNKENEYHEAVVNPHNYKNPDQMLAFEEEMRKAAGRPPLTME
ncbi:hypothetical protein L0222_04030 [bacterium]|nr:hypothetical protein [bacterium]